MAEPEVRPKRSYDERTEQIALVNWLRGLGLVHHSVPNSMSNDAATTSRFKQEGLVKGAPDLIILMPTGLVALELKKESGRLGDVAPEQWDMLQAYARTPGCRAIVAFGFRAAKAALELPETIEQSPEPPDYARANPFSRTIA